MQENDGRLGVKPIKQKKKKRPAGILRIALNIAVFALAAAAVFWIVTNREEIGRHGIGGLLSDLSFYADTGASGAEEIYYDVGVKQSFAPFNGGVAVASAGALSIYSGSGEQRLYTGFAMEDPVLRSAGEVNLVFDRGGNSYYLAKNYTLMLSESSEYDIINAKINQEGWFLLVTERPGYKATVSVYDGGYKKVYEWYSADQYVVCADLSPDSAGMVSGCVASDGGQVESRIFFFSLSDEKPLAQAEIPGSLLLDVYYTAQDGVCAVTTDGLYFYNGEGALTGSFPFTGNYLKAYAGGKPGLTAVLLGNYKAGGGGSLTVLDERGQVKSGAELGEEIISLSAEGGRIAALFADNLKIYSSDLSVVAQCQATSPYHSVILRGDGSALLIGEESVKVFIPEKG